MDLSQRVVRRAQADGSVLELIERAAPAGGFDPEARQFTVVASDETVDRYGDVIEAAGWQLDAYRSNNVVLVDHSYRVEDIVGRGFPYIEGSALKMRIELDPPAKNRKAAIVANLLETGSLQAVSVGFRPLEYDAIVDERGRPTGGVRFTKSELMEVSLVAVPANPAALIENSADEAVLLRATDERSQGTAALSSTGEPCRKAFTMSSDLGKRLETILERQTENRSEIDTLRDQLADLSAYVNEVTVRAVPQPAAPRGSAVERLGKLIQGFFRATKGGSIEAAYADAGFAFSEVKGTLNESTSTGGIYLVPTTLANEIFAIDGVSSAWRAAGSQIMQTDSGNINIPVRSADATITVTPESANATESTPTFSQTAVTLEKLKAYSEMTEEVLQDNAYAVGQYIQQHLVRRIEQKIDAQAFAVAEAAINVTYSGATPTTFDLFVKGLYTLPLAAQGSAVWVMRPEAFAKVLTIKHTIDTVNNSASNAALAGVSIFDGKPTPTLLGKPVFFTDQITGTNNSSSVFLGSFSTGAVLAEHSAGLVALIDPYSASVSGKVRVFVQRRAKAALPLPTAFCRIATFPHLT